MLDPQKTTNKPTSINTSHPTHYHQFQLKYLSQVSTLARPFSTHHPALTQSTSPLISEPPFDKSNFICAMVLSPNVKPTYTLMPSRISWHSTPFPTHSPFALQTSGKPNHVVWATNGGCTKPHAAFLHQEHSMYQTTCPHSTNHLQHHSTKGQHDTLYGSIALPFK